MTSVWEIENSRTRELEGSPDGFLETSQGPRNKLLSANYLPLSLSWVNSTSHMSLLHLVNISNHIKSFLNRDANTSWRLFQNLNITFIAFYSYEQEYSET